VIARRLVISGRVHGVGFRESLHEQARAEHVNGWVRNVRDGGTVEAVLQGDAAAVERVIAWCRRGPPAARVTDVTTETILVDQAHVDFVRRPSI